jgi:GAF domain-containing protein
LPTPVLPNEAARLAALRRYAILDTPPDEAFDRVARLAASLFNAPIALISFLDSERAWFKSHVGTDIAEIPRDITLCNRTVLSDEINLVPNALEDPVFATNPLVIGEIGVRFYAGAPLITRDGHRIGVLCVVDTKPRTEFGSEDQARLATLARLVMNELELKRELAVRAAVERDLALANELMSAIAEARGVKAAMEAALRIIREAVDASSARCWLLEGRRTSCHLLAAQDYDGPKTAEQVAMGRPTVLSLANSVVGEVLSTRKQKIVSDLTSLDLDRYPLVRQPIRWGYQSLICIPVEQDGRMFAMNFMFRHRIDDIEAVAERIEALVGKTRPILGRKIAEEQITLPESVVLNANDGVMVTQAEPGAAQGEPRIIYANPAFTRLTGYSSNELRGRSPELLWSAAHGGAGPIEQWHRALSQGRRLSSRWSIDVGMVSIFGWTSASCRSAARSAVPCGASPRCATRPSAADSRRRWSSARGRSGCCSSPIPSPCGCAI